MTPILPTPMGTPRRFDPRVVGLDEFFSLLQETGALLGAAPGRLCGLFLLVFLPVQLLSEVPYAGMPLRFSIASVGLAGYFVALEAVRTGRAPGLLNMLAPWRLPAAKLILLVVSGLLPLLCLLLVWWFDLGWEAVDSFLGGAVPADGFPMRQELEFILVVNFVGMPLLFIQPVCMLYSWSASRCLSANLMATAANWRWALALTLISIPIAIGLDSFDQKSTPEMLVCLMADVAIQMGMGAFTLVLMQRALR